MSLKILIIEELDKDELGWFNGYLLSCVILGYEYHVCHDVAEIPQVMKTFKPEIVFWIVKDYRKREVDIINKMRLYNKNLKVVVAYDFEMYLVGNGIADVYLSPAHIVPERFLKVIGYIVYS